MGDGEHYVMTIGTTEMQVSSVKCLDIIERVSFFNDIILLYIANTLRYDLYSIICMQMQLLQSFLGLSLIVMLSNKLVRKYC